MIKKFVYVTFQEEFLHKYEDAPEEVAYLKNVHRHIAHIKAEIEVFNNDREIEFIMLKHQLQNHVALKLGMHDGTNHSCETIAEMILHYLRSYYGVDRDITVEVSEDGENGCRLQYWKEYLDVTNLERS